MQQKCICSGCRNTGKQYPIKKVYIFLMGSDPFYICPRSERQVPAVSTASPWNQRNSFWISVSSATEYPSFWQMDSICLFGISVFGFLSSKYRIFDNN